MSQTGSMSRQFPSDFLFTSEQVPSNGLAFQKRQNLAKFIADIAAKLHVSYRCIYPAIIYMHRFFMTQSPGSFYPLHLCQAAILLACKSEQNERSFADIYKSAAEVLKIEASKSSKIIEFHEKIIINYESRLVSILSLGMSVDHPTEYISEILRKISDTTQWLSEQLINDLTTIANILAKQSILLTPFCVKYPPDLIAHFCVKLAIEIKSCHIESTKWMKKSYDDEKIQSLVNEFSVIYKKCLDYYKKNLTHNNAELYQRLDEITSTHADSFERKPVANYIIDERNNVPSSSTSHSDEQNSSSISILSSVVPPSPRSLDSSRPISPHQRLRTNIRTKPEQSDGRTGTKRAFDSTNNELARKRSSSSTQQHDKKQK